MKIFSKSTSSEKNKATCNYDTKQVIIGDTLFKLYPYKKITLRPRNETLVQIITNTNKTGITKKEETAPGVYIGECLITPHNYTGIVTLINTSDAPVEITTPHATLDTIEKEDSREINTVHQRENENAESPGDRQEKL